MNSDDHLLGTGKIVGDLHALEFVIRIFLAEAASQKIELPGPTTRQLPETFVTNYMSLGDLIDTYNSVLESSENAYAVGTEAVKIRDAIAHGRVFTSEDFPVTLYKFGKVNDGMVPVEYAEVLSVDWLNQKCEFLMMQISNVLQCARKRGYQAIKK